jgi:hypothetical protein
MVKVPQHGIVFEQVRQRFRVGYVINCDEVYVLVAKCRAKDVSANPTEPVDANFHRHALSPSRFRFRQLDSIAELLWFQLAHLAGAWLISITEIHR